MPSNMLRLAPEELRALTKSCALKVKHLLVGEAGDDPDEANFFRNVYTLLKNNQKEELSEAIYDVIHEHIQANIKRVMRIKRGYQARIIFGEEFVKFAHTIAKIQKGFCDFESLPSEMFRFTIDWNEALSGMATFTRQLNAMSPNFKHDNAIIIMILRVQCFSHDTAILPRKAFVALMQAFGHDLDTAEFTVEEALRENFEKVFFVCQQLGAFYLKRGVASYDKNCQLLLAMEKRRCEEYFPDIEVVYNTTQAYKLLYAGNLAKIKSKTLAEMENLMLTAYEDFPKVFDLFVNKLPSGQEWIRKQVNVFFDKKFATIPVTSDNTSLKQFSETYASYRRVADLAQYRDKKTLNQRNQKEFCKLISKYIVKHSFFKQIENIFNQKAECPPKEVWSPLAQMMGHYFRDSSPAFNTMWATMFVSYLKVNDAESEKFMIEEFIDCRPFTKTFPLLAEEALRSIGLHQKFQEAEKLPADLCVKIVDHRNWQHLDLADCDIKMPGEPENLFAKMSDFYKQQHTGRKLTLLPNYGRAQVTATFGAGSSKREYTIEATTLQMFVLMLFNQKDRLKLEEIGAKLGINFNKLTTIIEKLSHSGLLITVQGEEQLAPESQVSINESFHHQGNLCIDKVVVRNNKKPREAPPRKLFWHDNYGHPRRKLISLAAIYIMKRAKTMSKVELIKKVTAQLEDKYTGFDAKVDEVEYIVDRDEQNLEKKTEKEQIMIHYIE